jgi:hypothetical protein
LVPGQIEHLGQEKQQLSDGWFERGMNTRPGEIGRKKANKRKEKRERKSKSGIWQTPTVLVRENAIYLL